MTIPSISAVSITCGVLWRDLETILENWSGSIRSDDRIKRIFSEC